MVAISDIDLLQQLTASLPDQGPFLSVADGWGLRLMRTRAEVLAGQRLGKAMMISDSIGAAGQGASDPRVTSMAALVERKLQQSMGDGGSGFLSHEMAVKTGSWDASTQNHFAGTGALATATATLAWSGIRGTTVRIFHRNANISGTFKWRVDGQPVGFTNVTPPTVFGQEPGLVELTGLADIPHTVEVQWVSGTVGIMGVQGFRSTGIILDRVGQSGRAASDFAPYLLERIPAFTTTNGLNTVSTAAPGSFRPYMTGKYVQGNGIPLDTTLTVTSATAATLSANATASGTIVADLNYVRPSWSSSPGQSLDPFLAVGLGRPDLVIFMLGANDPAGPDYTVDTWNQGCGRWLAQFCSGTQYDYVPDFIFVIEHFGNWFDLQSRKNSIAAAIPTMAASVGGAVVDIWGIGHRSFKYWNDRGFFADAIHPRDPGHAAYAAPVISLIP